MKKVFRFLRGVLPHVTLILSLMLLTFFVIDLFNPSMAFLNNALTKSILATSSCLTAILSVLSVLEDNRKK